MKKVGLVLTMLAASTSAAWAQSSNVTIYGIVDRRNLPEVFNQFDFANPDITTGKRYETIVPQQALFMMNSPLVVEQARNLVNRPDFRDTAGPRERIKLLYDIIYQREPTETEMKKLTPLLAPGSNQEQALLDIFWALLNSREFLFNH